MNWLSNVKLIFAIEYSQNTKTELQVIKIEVIVVASYQFMKYFLTSTEKSKKSPYLLKQYITKIIETDEKMQKLSSIILIFSSPKSNTSNSTETNNFWEIISQLGNTWGNYFLISEFSLILNYSHKSSRKISLFFSF